MTFYGNNSNASYGMNGFAYSYLPWFTETSFKNMTDLEEPSNTVLFADMNWVDTFPRACLANPDKVPGRSDNLERVYPYRHVKNRTDYSFVDCSAKSIAVTRILELDWHKESTILALPYL